MYSTERSPKKPVWLDTEMTTERHDRHCLIALGYSIPQDWPGLFQDAAAYWVQQYRPYLCHEMDYGRKRGEVRQYWFYRWSPQDPRRLVTWQSIAAELIKDRRANLNRYEAEELARKMQSALDNNTLLKFVEEYEEVLDIRENESVRFLFEVYAVNINDVEDIEVAQVVAESPAKAQMKALAEIDMTNKDIDDWDFFTKEIGSVRRP